jgi:hypothetical protein
MKKLGTKIQLALPYHQQTDPAEWRIYTMQTVLINYKETNQVARFPCVEIVLNNNKNESTGYSPNELLYVARRSPAIHSMLKHYDDDDFSEVLAQAKHKVYEAFDKIKTA